MKTINLFFTAIAVCVAVAVEAQEDNHPKLHVNTRWDECSFQLDAGLSQREWHQFTKEAGLVLYFRPLSDAKPIGAGNYEVSILQWQTGIDEHDDVWNDTFVHPDSSHWLVGGPRLPIPGLQFRMGLTQKLEIGLYWTKSFGANYGFYGAQLQYNLINNSEHNWNTSIRGSFVRMYGPEDLNASVYGADIVTSKEFTIDEKWLRLAPYVSVSTMLTATHEKSEVVDLDDEKVVGVQGSTGLVAKVAPIRIAVEYNFAAVSTLSLKFGITF